MAQGGGAERIEGCGYFGADEPAVCAVAVEVGAYCEPQGVADLCGEEDATGLDDGGAVRGVRRHTAALSVGSGGWPR